MPFQAGVESAIEDKETKTPMDAWHHSDLSCLVYKEKTPNHRLVWYLRMPQFWLVR